MKRSPTSLHYQAATFCALGYYPLRTELAREVFEHLPRPDYTGAMEAPSMATKNTIPFDDRDALEIAQEGVVRGWKIPVMCLWWLMWLVFVAPLRLLVTGIRRII